MSLLKSFKKKHSIGRTVYLLFKITDRSAPERYYCESDDDELIVHYCGWIHYMSDYDTSNYTVIETENIITDDAFFEIANKLYIAYDKQYSRAGTNELYYREYIINAFIQDVSLIGMAPLKEHVEYNDDHSAYLDLMLKEAFRIKARI